MSATPSAHKRRKSGERGVGDGLSKKKAKHSKPVKEGKVEKGARSSSPKPPPKSSPADVVGPISELSSQERRELIAELSESVLEDPTLAFATPRSQQQHPIDGDGDNDGTDNRETAEDQRHQENKSKIRLLLDLADPVKNGQDIQTSRLAILSLLALFQDVLPTYRIRLPTAAEKSVRVSKETKKMWDFEKALLSHYQMYLKLLERTWEGEKGGGGRGGKRAGARKGEDRPTVLAVTSILCLCELLKSAMHFNFRSNVLSVVVRQMNHRRCAEVADACCCAVRHVFATDGQGEIALEATRLVAKLVKEKTTRIRPQVLRTFLSLPLRVHEDEAQAAKLAAAANAKKRKKDAETAEIESEMREGSGSVDKIVLARCQSDTLQAVTLTYFRILKSDDLAAKLGHVAELLPPALEGLAKFGHLINIDTVVDLLAVLKEMLKRVEDLPLDAALNCVLTAFQTLQGPGQEMQIDQKEFVTPLYSQLPRLCTEEVNRGNTELALKCLSAAFLKRREYSTVRTAAFIKQLCTVSLHAPPYTSAPLLAFVRQMLQRYPSVHQLLENEQDVITSGTYTPDVEDPEHTNPFATSAWELATLRFHVHPDVGGHAMGAAAGRMLQLPIEDPVRIRGEMVKNAGEGYIAHRVSKKRHPLAPRGNEGKRKRQQVRFMTPRKTGNFHLLSC